MLRKKFREDTKVIKEEERLNNEVKNFAFPLGELTAQDLLKAHKVMNTLKRNDKLK